ncbi:bifunctional 2-polyprenyl-6-hydroxyphenol methylase/3-demethylubiquinol 3-O-methyltransferase UbiG [Pasteurellaceae bacterium HPA106]|uniref:bifunctional 2-polyprenyl-6-hydroxyphenol methylase/3-demethylubiquinol 3-O-methyltransferase UbiG n=1 Tax=Spirabiliibacterium pneumoniae TaxID=221400 RepID=UPI001AAD9822|nr:bifunctional 2-polyprenyl-6-hydroxyphenol methylase/3-demethylubiquinol 3-O-methyltransferase UbiG [Spirabiliibacterium pneumoniae]MBE2896799.1 bifunctional 2-polyprenyl-6-hydroxyphenol methylase/3-demethylubiquinol 3-O-methyltransferase UbiG [Spirabiliibacterium pneumoniae]
MDNVSQAEVEKFNKMAASWWDPEGDFKPIHRLNPKRLAYICEFAAGLAGKRVLDVGCGGGILSESMARMGAQVVGIDMSPQPLAVAREHARDQSLSIDYRQQTIESLAAEQGGQFDVITCMEMLEHVPDPAAVVRACQQLLKPNGVVFFSTINRTLKAWALVVVGAEYVLKMLPKGTHDYDKFIKPAELLAWCDDNHLQCVNMQGYHYNPLSGQFWLNHDVSANYIMALRPKV